MAIEAQLYPNNAAFSISGSKNLMVDNIQSCVNYQLYSPQPGEQQCLQQPHHTRQMNQNMSLVDPRFSNSHVHHNAFKYNHNNHPLAAYVQALAELEQQNKFDDYITSQNEKLRIFLQEQRKQQVGELLKRAESNAACLLRQKDEEIAHARKKSSELNEFLRRLEVENQSWRRVAEEKEAMVVSLHNSLEEMKERALYQGTAEDAESCCDDNIGNTATEGESRLCRGGVGEVEQIRKRTMNCKCCKSQKSCFMFLPCRHLCSCKTCEPFLQLCPVCNMPKKSSIETLIV
ncbi:putative BOI-related E3 ubiquitin-protein ligase 3, partial [Mucuna pruriens]